MCTDCDASNYTFGHGAESFSEFRVRLSPQIATKKGKALAIHFRVSLGYEVSAYGDSLSSQYLNL